MSCRPSAVSRQRGDNRSGSRRITDEHGEYRIFLSQAREWWHGSPLRLDVMKEGSTVTPIRELAEAFSHKPPRLEWSVIHEDGERWIVI